MSDARTSGRSGTGRGSPRPSPEVIRRRRLAVGALAGGLVVVVALLTAFVWPGFAQTPEPEPAVTVTAAAPTPTTSPSALPKDATTFLQAMPGTVLQLALAGATPHDEWVDGADAVEAWSVTYAEGDAADAAKVDVLAGQWEDGDAATRAYGALVKAAGTPSDEGEVLVGTETAGAYVVTPGSTTGTAVVTWRNGTAVLQATGPADLVERFYSAFPL
ncbi:hypothetical protein LEP48_17295 [Isoptericola sp. NEAU-Y5]|uniref:Uncharacterized protein n=1 Tax=Isoptericola luteus TaxID=2879484 RepID=A0ABS7ZJC2_9MICO|nr:hypothetical protein [Isoptericola sp. NEAU-Y5]MCA5895088.1 hypothetical protein [Isoptericola sp. NEAU-Y5]